MKRRSFLKGTASGLIGGALAAPAQGQSETPAEFRPPEVAWKPVASVRPGLTRTWLGPALWANRLQDWRMHDGRFECLAAGPGDEVRTVAVLTQELVAGDKPAHFIVRTGRLDDGTAAGFCGFLIGAGAGRLDYRAAALVQKASGVGGGLLCTLGSDGLLRFRDHTSEEHPLAFAELETERVGVARAADATELRLDVLAQGQGRFDLKVTAWSDGLFLAGAIRRGVAESELLGGFSLVSSPSGAAPGARYWFSDFRTAGDKIALHPERASSGPFLGTLYSLNGRVLKLSAQLMPIGPSEPQTVKLEYRSGQGAWIDGPVANVEPGFTVLFRLDNWDSTRDWEYRVVYRFDEPRSYSWSGTIRRDPVDKDPLVIGLLSCTIAAVRSLEQGVGRAAELPGSELLGRYTDKCLYFPHSQIAGNVARQQPDLLVFAGDQLYEGSPTRRDNSAAPTLDYLYKWYLWVLSFRELTRNTPTIVLVDDHDMYHGNIWGNGGRAAPEGDPNRGGYRCSADFVRLVERTQCGHNPDAYDPTPIDRGIGVYYGKFRFGRVSFAVLEDRKFKTAPLQGADLDVHEAELLGPRQEQFLEAWAKSDPEATARICLTQTLLACLQTSPAGRPLLDFDSNGYPKLARDRAVDLLRRARALVLAGDQHLASVVRHGVDTFEDGVYQFTGPAAGSSWQRWFEPSQPGANGAFIDAFGNKVRVLAVANPKVSFAEYRKHFRGRGQGLGDRTLKSEGYGIVRVDRARNEFVLECWPWNVNPASPGARQFAGWPVRVKIGE